jgi:hypothetical protein
MAWDEAKNGVAKMEKIIREVAGYKVTVGDGHIKVNGVISGMTPRKNAIKGGLKLPDHAACVVAATNSKGGTDWIMLDVVQERDARNEIARQNREYMRDVTERRAKAKAWDDTHNEGAEGYNPYR